MSKINLYGFSADDVALMKKSVFRWQDRQTKKWYPWPEETIELVLRQAQRYGLDPLSGQITAIKKGGRWLPYTQIHGLRSIAARTGRYAPGRQTSYTEGKGGRITSATAWVRVMTQDGTWHDVGETAFMSEFSGPGQIWDGKPHVMLGKCAEALALRRAFPAELGSLYILEELEQDDKPPAAGAKDGPARRPAGGSRRLSGAPRPQQTGPADRRYNLRQPDDTSSGDADTQGSGAVSERQGRFDGGRAVTAGGGPRPAERNTEPLSDGPPDGYDDPEDPGPADYGQPPEPEVDEPDVADYLSDLPTYCGHLRRVFISGGTKRNGEAYTRCGVLIDGEDGERWFNTFDPELIATCENLEGTLEEVVAWYEVEGKYQNLMHIEERGA